MGLGPRGHAGPVRVKEGSNPEETPFGRPSAKVFRGVTDLLNYVRPDRPDNYVAARDVISCFERALFVLSARLFCFCERALFCVLFVVNALLCVC